MAERLTFGRMRLHRAYYLLAAFEVLTVAGALYLTHQLGAAFDASLANSRSWDDRIAAYATLDDRAQEVRAPGEDVFVSEDPVAAHRRFTAAVARFDHEIAAARGESQRIAYPSSRAVITADVDAVVATRGALVNAVEGLFTDAEQKQTRRMADHAPEADHALDAANAAIGRLQDDAVAQGRLALLLQSRRAATLRRSESAVGAGIVLIVLGAAYYGRRVSTQTEAAAAEREGHVAQLRETADALRRAEERLRLAARATNEALRDWELGTGTLWWNEAFGATFAPAGAPASVETWRALLHPDDAEHVERGLREFLQGTSEVWSDEYRVRRANGTYAWVLDRGFAVRDPDGAPQRLVSSMMDITERKEAERMKSDFVSFVSHQLRTPLAGMSWMLELAAETEHLPDVAREYIADARESAARLVTLVNDLLDIARLESGRTVAANEALSLEELTGSVLAEMSPLVAERSHRVRVDPGDVSRVWADPQLIRQVVTNLLSNAVKYTPAGGRIDIALQQQNGTVQWRIQDTGVGIPRAAQARLFERFYRADNAMALEVEGTGLGLHLVRLIVEQAGGRIWCESEEGRGAAFTFTLPAAQEGCA